MTPTVLYIDIETRSTADLEAVGVHRYAEDPLTEIICLGYAFDDEPVEVEDCLQEGQLPQRILEHMVSGGIVVAHNAQFERVVLRAIWNLLSIGQMRCTMAMALAMGLPGSLKNAAAAVGLEVEKDDEGHRLMLQMCKPRSRSPLTWWEDEERMSRLYRYCAQDVEVTRALAKRLLPLCPEELRVYQLDQEVNDRGIAIDMDAAQRMADMCGEEARRLDERMSVLTGGEVTTCRENAALSKWLGVKSVAKEAVTEMLASPTLPPVHRDVLLVRQEAAKSSVAKLGMMLQRGPWARGLFQYHGAATGRWAGRAIQPQNMPRPDPSRHIGPAEVDRILGGDLSRDAIEILYGSPLGVVADCLRGFLVARPGRVLCAVDFAAVEARVLAWLAGEKGLVTMFEKGEDTYCYMATRIYGRVVTKHDKTERQLGKKVVLGCGYGMGRQRFTEACQEDGIQMTESKAQRIVEIYRKSFPCIPQFWADVERNARNACREPGAAFDLGNAGLAFRVKGSFLWVRLPSGRKLCYPYPKIQPGEKFGKIVDELTYMSTDIGGRWVRFSTYGGSLVENITQAVARDLLADLMLRCERQENRVVLHVHDEVVVEVDEGEVDGLLERMERAARIVPWWASGLPIDAEGWVGRRYRK